MSITNFMAITVAEIIVLGVCLGFGYLILGLFRKVVGMAEEVKGLHKDAEGIVRILGEFSEQFVGAEISCLKQLKEISDSLRAIGSNAQRLDRWINSSAPPSESTEEIVEGDDAGSILGRPFGSDTFDNRMADPLGKGR